MLNIVRDKFWGNRRKALLCQQADQGSIKEAAFDYGIYGIALWDDEFNLITANTQYADLHKIPVALLKQGISLRGVIQNLKDRRILTDTTDPARLHEHITTSLEQRGHLTSFIKCADGTVLEISAERMSNDCTVVYVRNATREKMLIDDHRREEKKAANYANAIAKFARIQPSEHAKDNLSKIDEITENVAKLMSLDQCTVWTRSTVLNEAASASTYCTDAKSHIDISNLPLPDLARYLVALETSPIITINDLDNHAYAGQAQTNVRNGAKVRATLDVPFHKNGKILGVLTCNDLHKTREWTSADKMFALYVAERVGIVLDATEQRELWDLPTSETNAGRQAAE